MKNTLECEFWVPASLDEVWDFFSQPSNLEKITPQKFGAHVSFEGLENGRMKKSAEVSIEWRLFSWLPNVAPWKLKFVDMVEEGEQRYFVDEQVSGPFSSWKHKHNFRKGISQVLGKHSQQSYQIKTPGTWIHDQLEYSIPLGFLTKGVDTLFVRRQLIEMFAYREKKLKEIFHG